MANWSLANEDDAASSESNDAPCSGKPKKKPKSKVRKLGNRD